MADVQIVLKGVNQASAAINEVKGELGGLETGATQASSGLSTLAAAIPWAVLGAFALKTGEALLSLEQMREESAQVEARFVAFTGGVKNADVALDAMNNTVGNALTRDEKMAAAAQLMGLGLAKTAQEAADLTGKALTLGMSVETLATTLETGRTRGLVQYGISVSEVNNRAAELQRTNADLTDVEAKRIAILEQLDAKSQAVAAAGGLMATSMQQFDNATDTLKDTIADFINLEGIIKSVTSGIAGITSQMTGVQALKGVYGSPEGSEEQQTAISNRIAYLQDLVDRSNNGENIYRFNSANAQAEIDALRDRLNEIQNVDENLSGMGGFRLAEGYLAAKDAAEGVAAAAKDLGGYKESDYSAMTAKDKADDKGAAEYAKGILKAKENERKENERNAKDAARAYEQAMKQATDKLRNDVQGALSSGAGIAKGLFDATNIPQAGGLAPGANGPFEELYRIAAIAAERLNPSEATKQEMAKTGLNADSAAKILADFENQNWTADVLKYVDKPKLEQYIKDQIAKGQSNDSFVQGLMNAVGLQGATGKASVAKALGFAVNDTAPLPAAAPVSAAYTVNIQPGAIAVTGATDPATLASKIMSAVVAAFTKAEAAIAMPPSPLVAGAR